MLLQLVPTLISWVVVPTPLQYHATSHICQRPAARHARPVACAEGNENKGSLGRPLNPYVEALQNMSAPELVKGFAETAPPEVQQAVRATVISLMGNLPPHLYDTNVMTTGTNVASLMYSMQMTGYMFRNAQYRRSLLESLEAAERSPLLPSVEEVGVQLPEVNGKIKVKLSESMETEVEASAYMAELRAEVAQLRGQLATAKQASQKSEGGELLSYMQGLGRENAASLTQSVSQEVLDAMKVLIEGILSEAGVAGEQFMETSGIKLRELLVWQLITGYKLREMEAQIELNKLIEQ